MSSNVDQLIESCNFKLLSIVIAGIEIPSNYIQDIAIDWNGEFKIYGYATINDHFDIVNTMLQEPGQKMVISFIDNFDETFAREFIILVSSETKDQDYKGVKLRFQDVPSFTLAKTFKSKSFGETTLVKIFEKFLTYEVDALISGYPLEKKFKPSRILKNFIVPMHEDFLTFITREFKKEGIYFYQTRDAIVIGTHDVENGVYPYKQVGGKDLYGFNIIEYDLEFNNIQKTNVLQKANTAVFLQCKKVMKRYTKTLEDYKDKFKLDGKVNNSQLTYGVQLKTNEYEIDVTEYAHTLYKNNTELIIIVPGNIKHSMLWKKVDVELSGAVYTVETRAGGDIRLSGKYQIKRIEDKFLVGQKFIQRLTLCRINEGQQ